MAAEVQNNPKCKLQTKEKLTTKGQQGDSSKLNSNTKTEDKP